ncbi:S-layer homology domain-containing protein [Paenibacillus thalictri]|uniref:S-layer homology domain-containing protein n=1 Tax=Paenibacillus thalictri TaxID=2527873 RepID=UPI0013EEF69D|nr:S-layer homology domain-containing protein [Paenibacillus thalictri]
MKLVRKTLVLLLALIVITSANIQVASVFAETLTAPKVTVLQNDFIKITVDNATGRYGIRTVEGQPVRKKDQNVDMLFRGDDPETSFTTFRIDGTDYIFGNPYKFTANFFSEITPPRIVANANGTRQIETVWTIKGVEIKQILMLYADASNKQNAGNVNIRYEVVNRSGAQVQMGSRILLDTMVGSNDGPEFQIGTGYKVPLSVERKFVHEPDSSIPEEDRAYYKLPPYWVMRDKLDLSNPQATNVIAYGFNNFAEQNINILDEMIVGHWNALANTKWDYTPNPNLDFTRDTNDYGTADSAVALYWQPKPLANQTMQSFETVYGLGEIIAPDKVFSIRFMDTPQQLATLSDNSDYADEGIFDMNAEVENLASFNMEQSYIDTELTLDSGLNFVKLDDQGKIVRDAKGKALTESYRSKVLRFQKPATPAEAEQGIVPKFKPGDTITTSFKVQAKGKPWPTTKQYMMTVRSPETEASLQGETDEGIKAQYESNKSNFILLPAIGNAVPTYVFGMSPKEVYNADVKYLTVNISNIEAYNPGNETTEPNFDLFLKEKVTGKRYKVPIKSSVIMQPTDDGFSGDMRITYRGGYLVDSKGTVIQAGLGPELPLGQYQVEINYKGDTGGDAEIASMYSITTSQTFTVSDDDKNRIREAKVMAVYKQTFDLMNAPNSLGGELLKELNSAFPNAPFQAGMNLADAVGVFKKAKLFVSMASKALDPKFDSDAYNDILTLKKVPAYNYLLFDSEQAMDEFFEDKSREKLVEIRGMIKQAGSGNDQTVVVDTKTEPAIINDAVAYKGKDMVFTRGKLDVFGVKQNVTGYDTMPFFDTLFVKGDGTLSVASSGFVFHKGEWTLDFFNGFNKTLGNGYTVLQTEYPEPKDNSEDNSLNGSLKWATGALGDRLNPFKQLMVEFVYFNKHTLFSAPSFMFSGFGISFNDFILRQGGVSFGGTISLKILEAEVKNVVFNEKGFVGIDAALKFDLNQELGLIGPSKKVGDAKKDDPKAPSGEINITHYVQPVTGVSNRYGLKFAAELKSMAGIGAEISFKKVADGRILPDVLAFKASLPSPGIPITGATYLTGVRGALRELADTIAGGTKDDPFPLVIQAGISTRFGVAPAYHFGDIDLTLKRTGIKLEGKLSFSTKADATKDDLIPMLTLALIEAQWVTPWFVRLQAEVDIGGWNVIVGRVGIFVGENLEKHRTDFEGYIGAKVQIPDAVPVVGGIPLASVFFGLNNDKIWGSVGILFISVGITYYWGGGVEFGTSGEELPEGFTHLLVNDPERGQRLLVIGQGMKTVATSWVEAEKQTHEIIYRDIAPGMQILDNGAMNIGVGGIVVKNSGRQHEIPTSGISGNAIIEVEYTDQDVPNLALKNASGKQYPIIFDSSNTNPAATAFTQYIPAKQSSDQVDHRKAFIVVPQEQIKDSGVWTLTSSSAVQTRLLNVPTLPQLTSVSLTKDSGDANKFTASWNVHNAKAGDTINLYLTKDAVSGNMTKLENGKEVLDPGDPGMLIAKDIPVAEGSKAIDVTKINTMGQDEDIRGLLQQGSYYLRAELKSDAAFGTKTSAEKFDIVDPLAPQEVSDVVIEPAGNGYFELSFRPAAKKPALANFEHSYMINAMQEQNGKLVSYPNFGELMFTEAELEGHWNAATGKYEGIHLGGWTATTTSDDVDPNSLNGEVLDPSKVKYTGLQVGQEYVVGVSSVVKPAKEADKNENYHYAARTDSVKKLLPVPAKPVLETSKEQLGAPQPKIDKLTGNIVQQNIELFSDQQDVMVEAFYDGQPIGKTTLQNEAAGSHGTLQLTSFTTDGTYAIELLATNTKTQDYKVKMLYLTVDTIAPVLYLNEPLTGARTSGGNIRFAGKTSNDAVLKVIENKKETTLNVADDGTFSGEVAVESADPTVQLTVQVRDGAGNENTAIVSVTNDKFNVPAGLVIKQMPTMKPGDNVKLEASLRISDGKDVQGKPKFKEIPVSADKVSYSLLSGDAARLSDDGKTLTALSRGASLVQGEYQVSEGVTLQAFAAANVDIPAPTQLESIQANTSAIANDNSHTKVNVTNAGETLGFQLVYKVFSKGAGAAPPALNQDISSWSFLPANGVVYAGASDSVVVAKRISSSKLAVASTDKLSASIWQAPSGPSTGGFLNDSSGGGSGGGGGGGGGPVGNGSAVPSEIMINQQRVNVEKKDDVVAADITVKHVDAAGAGDIVIASRDNTAKGYKFRLDKEIAQQAIAKRKNIVIEVPLAKLTLTPNMLAGMKENLDIQIFRNLSYELDELGSLAASLDSTLLAGGQGVSVKTNIPAASWGNYAIARIPLPDSLQPGDITAVVLKGSDGSWTPVPWKLDATSEVAAVNVQLSGEGNLVFIRNAKTFGDVQDSFWGKDSIAQAAAKLFVLGKADDSFEPESRITRAEYPTMLLRVAGMMNKRADAEFTDIAADDWFNRSVGVAAQMGVIEGLADGSFAPQATVSRMEAMTMAGRLLKALGRSDEMSAAEAEQVLDSFADGASVPEWAKIPVAICIKNGIIEGDDNHVNPSSELTRAQAAAIAIRLDAWLASH